MSSCQRTHGQREAVAQKAELGELNRLADWTQTKTGMKNLKKAVRDARPVEHRMAS